MGDRHSFAGLVEALDLALGGRELGCIRSLRRCRGAVAMVGVMPLLGLYRC